MTERRLILASTSPYRRALLERLNLPFECVAPGVDESDFEAVSPRDLALNLANAKARAVAANHPQAVVIGGDQVVAFDGEILGKPGSPEAAMAQIRRLAGHVHELVTAIAIVVPDGSWTHIDVTRLSMRALDEDEIRRYIAHDRPWDCAGSYKIESLGVALFDAVEGVDPTAIVGMPLMALARGLRRFGFLVP